MCNFFLTVTFLPSLFHQVLQISCLGHSAHSKVDREETCEETSGRNKFHAKTHSVKEIQIQSTIKTGERSCICILQI